MAKGKTSNKNQQAKYQSYKTENRHSKNKLRRMRKHLKTHPNDEQTAKVLKGEVVNYTRNKHGDSPGATKKDLEDNKKTTIGKRKVYDSKGFVINGRKNNIIHNIKSIREKFKDLGIHRGRDFSNKTA